MNIQDSISRQWIDWARPSAIDADEFFQVEIRLGKQPDPDSTQTAMSFWGNVGLGTPWRRTWRWRVAQNPEEKLRTCVDGSLVLGDDESVVRTYRSISRAWNPKTERWVFDAVADDGTAWYAQDQLLFADSWQPHRPLPQPDQLDD